ncbi:protein PLASTID REDOX INSENSITIVE 2, chloroplastic-like isoform X2 [Papaver somniferum]|uniref:protein PLASTID REDOX INSENSITIVE 2, chloroplastic-like isoform X2 n=1 Tax=Papaver somniferum TaxID=3469 RepID=UPI000E6F9164|nr:protein PLASTID REDOX INSENSITIVE 2, chloroplastic-like isoform X2 [Papaver somniferum]
MAMSKAAAFSSVTPITSNQNSTSLNSSLSSTSVSFFSSISKSSSSSSFPLTLKRTTTSPSPSVLFSFFSSKNKQINGASEYKFPDPIPEFAEAETEKFRANLIKKLSKKDIYGDSIEEVVGICTEIFNTFLHTEYGGPGTLLVIPFIDMADTLTERGLPGAPQAARAALVWAQKHVDKDWNKWTGTK